MEKALEDALKVIQEELDKEHILWSPSERTDLHNRLSEFVAIIDHHTANYLDFGDRSIKK